jgi:hypothetical protein
MRIPSIWRLPVVLAIWMSVSIPIALMGYGGFLLPLGLVFGWLISKWVHEDFLP